MRSTLPLQAVYQTKIWPSECPDPKWWQTPNAKANGVIAGLATKVVGFNTTVSALVGVGVWYLFSGRWHR
jgi:hypothetical protein